MYYDFFINSTSANAPIVSLSSYIYKDIIYIKTKYVNTFFKNFLNLL